ncbi:CDGSH iron-sulfur domain-containing protein [Rhodobacteraceae bacterium]|nr:CDGSH iron-sulfur domain-containing protein [Paracoccaceae bacterium]
MTKTYTGKDIEIAFDMKRCIHARNCFLKLPQVFDPEKRPWVSPDVASADEIAAMVRTCPSGALTYRRLDSIADEAAPGHNRAMVLENGPLALHGNLSVDNKPMVRATICRCGQTNTPPFCDHSHVDAGFTATNEPEPSGKDAAGDDPGGELAIIARENGSIEAKGALEITGGSGKRVHRGTRAFLCRCGASKNKPFCDGSHKAAGFEVPGD